jgi:hypothetical protein
MGQEIPVTPFGKYPNYQDIARLEYGRMLWKSASSRGRLLSHWMDPAHPYADRFRSRRTLVERVLESRLPDEALDIELRAEGHSLRAIAREIPPVFGSI